MAKLEVKKIEDKNGHTIHDYQILIDGHEPTMITGLELSLNVGEVNHAKITFLADDVYVDGDFLALLKAKVDSNG